MCLRSHDFILRTQARSDGVMVSIGGSGSGSSAVSLHASVSTTPAGDLRGAARFTAVPPGRALLEDSDTIAVGSVGGWNVVTLGDAMRDGVWEWEVEFVSGSTTCQLAVFEGPPRAAAGRLPNANDDNVLCTAIAGTMRYVRGAGESSGPSLGVHAGGQRLRVRYAAEAGTVDVSVDGRPAIRSLEGVRRGDVRAGFFLSGTSKIRIISFKCVEGSKVAVGSAVVRRACAWMCGVSLLAQVLCSAVGRECPAA